MASVRSGHRVSGGSFAEPPSVRGLVDHVRELVRREDVAEVHERPRDRGDGDSLVRRDVARVQRPRAMQPHARVRLSPLGRNDINEGGPVLTHLPVLRRGQMTQRRPLTCPKHRRQELTLAREPGMTDRVDPAPHSMQTSLGHAPRDRGRDPGPRRATAPPSPARADAPPTRAISLEGVCPLTVAWRQVSGHTPESEAPGHTDLDANATRVRRNDGTAGQGLEPQLPEPESGVLPITPPGNGSADQYRPHHPDRSVRRSFRAGILGATLNSAQRGRRGLPSERRGNRSHARRRQRLSSAPGGRPRARAWAGSTSGP